MGQFSWITLDTNISIYSTEGYQFTVYLLCPDGTKLREDSYEGYGEFGGQDVYALVARWNYPEKCNGDNEHDRSIGIEIACYDEDHSKLKYPIKLVEDGNLDYNDIYGYSTNCPEQGWYQEYEDGDEDTYYDDEDDDD